MTKRIVLGDISEDQNGNAVIDTLEGDIYIENGKVVVEVPQANEWEFRDADVNHNGNDVTNVGALDADKGRVGTPKDYHPDKRRLISEGETEYYRVDPDGSEDYETIQAAVNDIPLYVRNHYFIKVNDGDYSDEDVFIPPIVAGGRVDGYEFANVTIRGNESDPSTVKVNSITSYGSVGPQTPTIAGFELHGTMPEAGSGDAVDGGISIYHAQNATVRNCRFLSTGSDGDDAITSYGATIKVQSTIYSDRGVVYYCKSSGNINAAGATVTGDPNTLARSISASYVAIDSSNAPDPRGNLESVGTGGRIYDEADGTLYGVTAVSS